MTTCLSCWRPAPTNSQAHAQPTHPTHKHSTAPPATHTQRELTHCPVLLSVVLASSGLASSSSSPPLCSDRTNTRATYPPTPHTPPQIYTGAAANSSPWRSRTAPPPSSGACCPCCWRPAIGLPSHHTVDMMQHSRSQARPCKNASALHLACLPGASNKLQALQLLQQPAAAALRP